MVMERLKLYRILVSGMILAALWASAFGFLQPLLQATIAELTRGPVPADRALGASGSCDFAMFWAVGRMAMAGHAANAYQPALFHSWQALHMNHVLDQLVWVYPPPALLFAAAFQVAKFVPAFYLWEACLTAASAWLLRRAGLAWPVILAGMMSPAALLNFDRGQLGLITGALFITGMVATGKGRSRAGAVFALLIVKPQAGLLAPVILLAQGNWRGLLFGAAVAGIFSAVAVACFGWGVWPAYFGGGVSNAHQLLAAPFPRHPFIPASYELYGVSVLWMLRSFGFGLTVSSIGQMIVSITACAICLAAWRGSTANAPARMALTTCLVILTIPYGFVYDLCACSIAVANLAWQERRFRLSDILLFTWPVSGVLVAVYMHLELTPLILMLTAGRAIWSMNHPVEAASRPWQSIFFQEISAKRWIASLRSQ